MDSEYLDLCREVYKRTKWWQKEARAIFNPKDNGAGLYKYFEGYQYTTDYLLEMLPKELHKDEKIHYLTLSSKYGDEFKANYVSPTGHCIAITGAGTTQRRE